MSKESNIDFVVKNHLCTSCGTCVGICPYSALSIKLNSYGVFAPFRNVADCTDCSLCVSVCPGHKLDYHQLHTHISGSIPPNETLGPVIGTYCGFTRDTSILPQVQSGGVVSSLLIYCLHKGLIDGAIVSRWSPEKPLIPQTYIARDRSAILASVGSIYNPVPASILVGDLLRENGRFAFVGTSCQIQGMRKAEMLRPELKEKISLYIGLHCLGVFTFNFHDQVLHKLELKREEVVSFRHKDKSWRGWPCDMKIVDKYGVTHNLDANQSRLYPRPFFTAWRCQLCYDKANEFSDISCGDCRIVKEKDKWSVQGYDIRNGISEVVARTTRGHQILQEAIDADCFTFRLVSADDLCSSIAVAGKKLGVNTFSFIQRLFGLKTPTYDVFFALPDEINSPKWTILKLWEIAASSRYLIVYLLSRHKWFRKLLMRIRHNHLRELDRLFRNKVCWARFTSLPRLKRIVRSSQTDALAE